jgi:hypothetical protein
VTLTVVQHRGGVRLYQKKNIVLESLWGLHLCCHFNRPEGVILSSSPMYSVDLSSLVNLNIY